MAQTIDKLVLTSFVFKRLFWPSVRNIVIDWDTLLKLETEEQQFSKQKNYYSITEPECAYRVYHDGHRTLGPGLRSYYLEEPT